MRFVLGVLLGKPTLVRHFADKCPDFVTAGSLPELATKMGEVTGDGALDPALMEREVRRYDDMIGRGKALFNDDQLRRIAQLRNWRGDRLRTAKFQAIADPAPARCWRSGCSRWPARASAASRRTSSAGR